PQPGAGLYLREDEPRRDEGIRNIRRQIHLQAIESEQEPENPADEEVQPVDRQAADEDPEGDRGGFTGGTGAFGSKIPEEPPKHPGHQAFTLSADSALPA